MTPDDREAPKVLYPTFPDNHRPLKSGGGGDTPGGMTDDWKISVEQQLTQLHGDVRHLLFGLIGGFLILLGGGIAGYLLLEGKFSNKFDSVEARLGAMERKSDVIDAKIDILLERQQDKAQ